MAFPLQYRPSAKTGFLESQSRLYIESGIKKDKVGFIKFTVADSFRNATKWKEAMSY